MKDSKNTNLQIYQQTFDFDKAVKSVDFDLILPRKLTENPMSQFAVENIAGCPRSINLRI